MTAWCDGQFVAASQVPKPTAVSPFETMGASRGELPLWERHLRRLAAAAARLRLPFTPAPAWRAAAAEVLRGNGHDDDVLRLQLVARGTAVHVVMTTRQRSPVKVVQLLPTIVERPANAPPADLKADPRTFHDAVRQQAQDGQADDGIVVAGDGAVLETALGNLWLRLDGQWVTPPLDGRVLPGIARELVLAGAAARGVAVAERVCDLADLHRADALAHSNAVHGVRPATLVGQSAAVQLVDSELLPLWRASTAT
jgi:para-aminobenzoate synthetase / 4-amino-4-deoxychorismate lyase